MSCIMLIHGSSVCWFWGQRVLSSSGLLSLLIVFHCDWMMIAAQDHGQEYDI